MKNLKKEEKRLFFSIIITIIICMLIFSLYSKYNRPQITDNSSYYINQIDSLNRTIDRSNFIIDLLQIQIDSLESKKVTVINNHNEKINIIRDASAENHAKWLESVIRSLENYREFK
jgi:cell division protein FtsL